MKKNTLPNELFKLEELIGDFIQYWGFKKIHGRVWTHLYTSKNPLCTADLIERLKVTKGLLSVAIRELEHYDVIFKNNTDSSGTVFYKANPDLVKVICNVIRNREQVMLDSVESSVERLLKLTAIAGKDADLDEAQIYNLKKLTSSANQLLAFFLLQEFNTEEQQQFAFKLDT